MAPSLGTIGASVALSVCLLLLTLGTSPAQGASGKACRVTNTGTRQTFTTLQAAVDAARSGAHLVVRGTCHGSTLVERNMLIEGRRTKRSGRPTLDGDGKVRPLIVKKRRPNSPVHHVTIRNLTIQHGVARPPLLVEGYGGKVGGGIWSNATMRLDDVVLRDNRAVSYGGGIYTQWSRLRLYGTTSIKGNRSGYFGGGLFCWYGVVVLNDSSSIERNQTSARSGGAGAGGGVACWGGLRMNDSSRIVGNRADTIGGGGYIINATFELNDAAAVRDNRSGGSGGGIYFDAYIDEENWHSSAITLSGSSVISGNRAGTLDSCCEPKCRHERPRGGGLWTGSASVLTMTGSSVISGNEAACGAGGLYSEIDPDEEGASSGVSCAPQSLANVHGNTPDDCYFE